MAPRMRIQAAGRTKKQETRENQKRKLLAEAEEDTDTSSHTNSTANNKKSESWECPLSTRRKLTMSFPSRRASLRSSKRLFEAGITSCSRSSQPHNSREISPVIDITQQLDHTPLRVQKASLVPSCYTLDPEMLNDKSLSNHSTQMEGQNIFEEECIPHRQEYLPLPENIIQQDSNNSQRANHSKDNSNPSFSSRLTEFANMMDNVNHDEDEIDSAAKTPDGYQVRPEFIPILTKVVAKHGDIAKNCTSLTMKDRAILLEMICGILQELKDQEYFSKTKSDFLRSKIALLDHMKHTKLEVGWLREGLVEMLRAREFLEQCGMLKEKKETNRKAIEDAEREMDEFEKRKKELSALFKSVCDEEAVCKETLAKAKDESLAITQTAKKVKSEVWPFISCSLMDVVL